MSHPRAGLPPAREDLVDLAALEAAYRCAPDPTDPAQRVQFGTSGHRGTALKGSFNEAHVVAICRVLAEYRALQGIRGPLFLGHDPHALSEHAVQTARDALCACGIQVVVQTGGAYVATPVLSHAILSHNAAKGPLADGVVITPSHNPPEDGGFKYNPPSGGPASPVATTWIERRANEILEEGVAPLSGGAPRENLHERDLVGHYVEELGLVVDLAAIASAGIRLAVDTLGGAAVAVWPREQERYGLDLEIHNPEPDGRFGFVRLDSDGRIRMDCSSAYCMQALVELHGSHDLAVATDADCDRHGVVVPGSGLLAPNAYLPVAARYLFRSRPAWTERGIARIGKSIVTTALLDRVGEDAEYAFLVDAMPVGFKWFVDGLGSGAYAFACEESAGATFLRRSGDVWTTDKDGFVMGLLAAEMLARTGVDPARSYRALEERFGRHVSRRIDRVATPERKALLAKLGPAHVATTELAGDPVRAVRATAPANGEPIGGVFVESDGGWFAARPSGTEDKYKLYAESYRGDAHLQRIVEEAEVVVDRALASLEVENPAA